MHVYTYLYLYIYIYYRGGGVERAGELSFRSADNGHHVDPRHAPLHPPALPPPRLGRGGSLVSGQPHVYSSYDCGWGLTRAFML